jgi:hypothetical protein
VGRFGRAAHGGVAVKAHDNEPRRGKETHHDVHPEPLGYHELAERSLDYARAIKSADPTALVLGPADVVWDDCWKCADNAGANGGAPFGRWYLERMADEERASGRRVLDYFSQHYPGGSDSDQISRAVDNIRKWKRWVEEVYPGTRIAIDEYSWNRHGTFLEGLHVAEGLGVFGREGVSLASYWSSPDWNAEATSPAAMAFRLMRSYDGAGGAFGDTSVQASSSMPSLLAVYAAVRDADGALTMLVVNRSAVAVEAAISVSAFAAGARAQGWRLSPVSPTAIQRVEDAAVAGGALSVTFPSSSATILVLARS